MTCKRSHCERSKRVVLFAALAALRLSVWCRKAPEAAREKLCITRSAAGCRIVRGLVWEDGRVVCAMFAVCCSGMECDGVICEASIATWLILPVVIRSSQRLSHACVSINKFLL